MEGILVTSPVVASPKVQRWQNREGAVAGEIRGIPYGPWGSSLKRRNQHHWVLEHEVNGAMTRVQMGELTAARQELEGAELAPGTETTLRQL